MFIDNSDDLIKAAIAVIAAQAAVIESLRDRLLDVCTEVESADMLLSHGNTKGALVGVRRAHVAASLGFSLLKRTGDGKEILAEVRLAERERCAKVCEAKAAGARYVYQREELTELAAAIRAME